MCLFMSMLYCKIKIVIDINNHELLEHMCKHMKEIKKGERGRKYYQIDKPSYPLPLFLPFYHISK